MKSKPFFLYQLLVSHFLIFLCPMLIIGLYFIPLITKNSMKQISDNNLNYISQVQFNTEQLIKSISAIPYSIDTNGVFREYKLKNPYDEMVAITKFNEYIKSNPYIYNAIFHLKSNNMIYTRNSIMNMEDFGKQMFTFENWSPEEIRSDLANLTTPMIRPSEKVNILFGSKVSPRNVITFIYPVGINSKKPYGTLILMVDEEQVFNRNNTLGGSLDGNIIISDREGHVIYSNEKILDEEFKTTISSSHDSFSTNMRIGNEKYIVSSILSLTNGWHYTIAIPEHVANRELNGIRTSYLNIMLLLLLLEMILIFFSYRTNYIPIRNILTRLKKTVFPGLPVEQHATGKIGEIDIIENAFLSLSNSNRKLQNDFQINIPYIRECLLHRLISGSFEGIDEFNEIGSNYGVTLDFAKHAVAILATSTENDHIQEVIDGLHLLEDEMNKSMVSCRIFFVSDISKEKIIMLLSYDLCQMDNVTRHMEMVRKAMLEKFGLPVYAGIGNFSQNIGELQRSYSQAMYACQYTMLKGVRNVMTFEETENLLTNKSHYNVENMYRLKYAITLKEYEQVVKLVEVIVANIMDDRTPVHMIRLAFIDVMQMIYEEIKKYDSSFADFDMRIINPFLNSRQFTVIEYVEYIRKYSEYLLKLIGDGKDNRKSVIEDILIHINMNYLRYDFSIQTVSDAFGMLVSNFSAFFKRHTGENFIDYVDSLRTAKAKELLKEQSINIGDIACQLGYSSSSSFGRNFRRAVGMTPGEYRKKDAAVS